MFRRGVAFFFTWIAAMVFHWLHYLFFRLPAFVFLDPFLRRLSVLSFPSLLFVSLFCLVIQLLSSFCRLCLCPYTSILFFPFTPFRDGFIQYSKIFFYAMVCPSPVPCFTPILCQPFFYTHFFVMIVPYSLPQNSNLKPWPSKVPFD